MAAAASTETLSSCARPLPNTLSSSPRATRLAPFASRRAPAPARFAPPPPPPPPSARSAPAASLTTSSRGSSPSETPPPSCIRYQFLTESSVFCRAEDVGYVSPTEVQEQSLPVLLSGQDCILHAQVAELCRFLLYNGNVISVYNCGAGCRQVQGRRWPTSWRCSRRYTSASPRRRRWSSCRRIQAEPPAIIVATVASLCQMVEKRAFSLGSIKILVIDESDVVHVHVNPVQPMPSHLRHTYVICSKKERLHVLLSLLERDAPKSVIIFVAQQSEKSKRAGNPPSSTLVVEFLRAEYKGTLEVLVLEEDMNFNARATSFTEVKGKGFLLVSTDIASRGFDLPQTSHIYNFDLPKTATDYLHRAGRTGREPFSKSECSVTTLITEEERFVLQRFQNELKFHSQQLPLESMFAFNL
uniref:RNA helicase n=1 Tax=Aegilops tauschii TaxID=37682 RepID=M8B793_AEGTA